MHNMYLKVLIIINILLEWLVWWLVFFYLKKNEIILSFLYLEHLFYIFVISKQIKKLNIKKWQEFNNLVVPLLNNKTKMKMHPTSWDCEYAWCASLLPLIIHQFLSYLMHRSTTIQKYFIPIIYINIKPELITSKH